MPNYIIFSRKGSRIADRLIKYLKRGNERFECIDEGDLHRYLGVDIIKHKDGRIEVNQPHMKERFLELVD